jgi:hypothetical protein
MKGRAGGRADVGVIVHLVCAERVVVVHACTQTAVRRTSVTVGNSECQSAEQGWAGGRRTVQLTKARLWHEHRHSAGLALCCNDSRTLTVAGVDETRRLHTC